ncbi:MAG: Gfo/Idh/MocA family oxidoreductase [Acidobacteria bacterium]|nr:Gfo/Idh/MocA family oxidoreductase [Acidobacteriota bacterium]
MAKGLEPFLSGDWFGWAAKHGLPMTSTATAVASNSEFTIEIVPDIKATGLAGGPLWLLGGFFDSFVPEKVGAPPAARVHEFQTHGMALIDAGTGTLELHVAEPGDKIVVPPGCYCALYSLGETVVTVQVSCSGPNHKIERAKWSDWLCRFGPPLLGYYNDKDVVFVLNHLHLNSLDHAFGVRLPSRPEPEGRQIRLSRITRNTLATFLHRELTSNPEVVAQFRSLGIQVRKATPEAIFPADSLRPEEFAVPLYFSGHLASEDMKRDPDSRLRAYLYNPTHSSPDSRRGEQWKEKLQERLDGMRQHVQLNRPKDRRLQVVVEGTGAWTQEKYRPAIRELKRSNPKRSLAVYYVNDENWSKAPVWDPPLEPWEVYLRKEYSQDGKEKRYVQPGSEPIKRLNEIDAVFVVTPDVTHAAVVNEWLGNTPVVFVEKPFESEVSKVQDLLERMARNQIELGAPTAVVAIDHYLLRLSPLFGSPKNLASVLSVMGDGLKEVCFEMTEKNLIEAGRERTLALGLGLDLLPHFAAILFVLGSIESIDLVQVTKAAQYHPLQASGSPPVDLTRFDNETSIAGRCRFEDYSGYPVQTAFCAGKSVSPDAKQLILVGSTGNQVTIDFQTSTVRTAAGDIGTILTSNRAYEEIFLDLYNSSNNNMLPFCLKITDAEQVVRFLDTMWRAAQWIKSNGGFERVRQGQGVCECAATGRVK